MSARGPGGTMEVLTLDLQGEMFALEAASVREILDMIPVTEVPGADDFVSGLINVRGRVVPLADLRMKLGLERRPATIDTRIVVIEADVDGDLTVLGIRADKVHEVAELAAAMMEDVPRIGLRWPSEYIRAVGKRGADFIMVLNVDRLFSRSAAAGPPAEPFLLQAPAAH